MILLSGSVKFALAAPRGLGPETDHDPLGGVRGFAPSARISSRRASFLGLGFGFQLAHRPRESTSSGPRGGAAPGVVRHRGLSAPNSSVLGGRQRRPPRPETLSAIGAQLPGSRRPTRPRPWTIRPRNSSPLCLEAFGGASFRPIDRQRVQSHQAGLATQPPGSARTAPPAPAGGVWRNRAIAR